MNTRLINFEKGEKHFPGKQKELVELYAIIEEELDKHKANYLYAMNGKDLERIEDLLHKANLLLNMFAVDLLKQALYNDALLIEQNDHNGIEEAREKTSALFDLLVEKVKEHKASILMEGKCDQEQC